MLHLKRLWLWYGLAIVIVVIDQVTKVWAESTLSSETIIVIENYFKFELAYNRGAAFSFLGNAGGWQRWFFVAISAVVSVALIIWIARIAGQAKAKRLELLALSLVLGGAVGNLWDRALLGHVIDFIVWHYHQYQWPTFNIADSAIFLGAGILIVDMLFFQKSSDK